MIRLATRLLILSAIGVLLLPGNERHRDQVVKSLGAAYANAGEYCNRNQRSCDRIVSQLKQTGTTLTREVANIAGTVATADSTRLYREPY